jgi:hypothetical protein
MNISYRQVRLNGFWKKRQDINARETLPAVYDRFAETGRFSALTLAWREGMPNKPHIFFDSDTAKWVEGAAYTLQAYPNPETEKLIDDIVNHVAAGMTPEGYFNSYYQTVEPHKRFTDRNNHELYCAGHWIEAAVAYDQATGKSLLLDLMKRYARYIRWVFVEEKNAAFDTPGHEEIELALIRLSRHTGETEWFDLALHFLNARGTNKEEQNFNGWFDERYAQDQAPLREQTSAEGHAVRWAYLYCAAAEAAKIIKDRDLLEACQRVWRDVMDHKLYVTGGIGNLKHGEAFGPDYYLPNYMAYAETCASIGLALFAQRMLEITPSAEYADIVELEIYNGALAGVSLDGKRFFYENPLAMRPADQKFMNQVKADYRPAQRLAYFGCSCCPPNMLRFMASMGGFFYGREDAGTGDGIFVHQYGENEAEIDMNGTVVRLRQETNYPWEGSIKLTIGLNEPVEKPWTLAVRLPGWCETPHVGERSISKDGSNKCGIKDGSINDGSINDDSKDGNIKDGYYHMHRVWVDGDTVLLHFPMPVTLLEANTRVAQDCGRVALKRGPIVYCVEETDNGPCLADMMINPDTAFADEWQPDVLGGVCVLRFEAFRRKPFMGLYRKHAPEYESVNATAVPYYAWGNREEGEMAVWLGCKNVL